MTLLKRGVQDGRVVWQMTSSAKTNSEGVYRFAGLSEGEYTVYTDPAMDNDPATSLVDASSLANVTRSGFASQFYPDARELTAAGRIRVAGGEQAQANFTLVLEPFHTVTANVVFPGNRRTPDAAPERAGMGYTALVLDAQGHQLPYTAQYNQATHSVQALLPDGNYSLLVTAASTRPASRMSGFPLAVENGPGLGMGTGAFTGAVDFSVAGHAVANLRVPLLAPANNPIQVTVLRTGAAASRTGTPSGDGTVFVALSQAGGWMADGVMSAYAQGFAPGQLNPSNALPGSYWVHTRIAQRGLCTDSFTSGGVNLAREPLLLEPAAPRLRWSCDCGTIARR